MVLLGIAFYLLVAPFVFKLVFPLYPESINYSLLLIFLMIGTPFSLIYTFFQSQAMESKIVRYNGVIRAAQLILTVSLVPFFGILGAVFARICFQLVSIIALIILFLGNENRDCQKEVLV